MAGPTVSVKIDGSFVDISSYVMAEQRVDITRGRATEFDETPSQTCRFRLRNTSARFSGDVPGTTYFRKFVLGAEVKVTISSDTPPERFYGEISSLTPGADSTGNFTWVDVEAAGIMRRLGIRPAFSPLRMSISSGNGFDDTVVGYWPMEEDQHAVLFPAAVPVGGPVMTATGDPGAAAASDLVSSYPLPSPKEGSVLRATVPSFPSTWTTADLWTVAWVMKIPAQPASELTLMRWYTAGNPIRFDVVITAANLLMIRAYSQTTGAELLADTGATFEIGITNPVSAYEKWLLWTAYPSDAGGGNYGINVQFTNVTLDLSGVAVAVSGDNNLASAPAQPTRIEIPGSGESSPFSVGHVAVFPGTTIFDSAAAGAWSSYERAGSRIGRICDEYGISRTIAEPTARGQGLGPQPLGSILEVLHDAARTDQGVLHEPRDSLKIAYRPGHALLSQASTCDLDYASDHLFEQLAPEVDDFSLANDVTASGRSSARYVVDDDDPWHRTTEDPPSGVGVRQTQVQVNIGNEDRLRAHAAWHANLRSRLEPRYRQITVHLGRTAVSSKVAQIAALDVGHVMTVANTPSWVARDNTNGIELMVQGYREVVDKFERIITFNTSPARAWEAWPVDTGGSTLVVAVNSSATSLKLATSAGPEWSTTAEPYHLVIAGEAMTVTAMTTDTPAFIAAGAAAHGNNASITPALPAGITADVGQLLLIWAAIRNSGTGTVDLPSGWTSIVNFANARLMGRYYVTGDAAPLVTFTGGVAGADTSAQMCAFSGLSMHLASATASTYASATPAANTQLNSSAQDIAYPAVFVNRDKSVAFALGWKQDDWTSVATPAAMDAEIGEPDTTTGDDQGIAWYYDIQSTATDIAAGTLTVTGGASAISRAVTLALRPLQTATVTRSVNGVTGSIAAAEAVTGWRMGVNAL